MNYELKREFHLTRITTRTCNYAEFPRAISSRTTGYNVKFKTQNLSVPAGATPRVLQTVGGT